MDTFTDVPCTPLGGLMFVSVATAFTVKVTAPLVPADVCTVTLRAPGAAAGSIATVAVNVVELETVTLLTVIPAPALTVAPVMKFAPVNVTPKVEPCTPLGG